MINTRRPAIDKFVKVTAEAMKMLFLDKDLDETGKVDARAKKIKPQDLVDRRYLDNLKKTRVF